MSGALALLLAVAAAAESRPVVDYAEVAGSIDPGSAAYLIGAIRSAQSSGAEALLVRLDTPGGLLSSTRDIVQEELSAKVPIIFWVGPPGARAGSAGVFLTLAAHVATMAPSTNIGAAHPVDLSGAGEKADDNKHGGVMDTKIENDTAAFVQGIAERRSRNVEWAVKAVRESVSVTSSQALTLKVIDLVAEDVPSLLHALDGRTVQLPGGEKRTLHTSGARIREVVWPVRDRVLHGIANPEVAYLIAMLGVIGVLLELFHPGSLVPGIVGGLALLVAAVAFQMLPVRAGAVALIVAAVALFLAEAKVGGHGGFVAGGAVALTVGSLLLVGHVSPEFYADADFGIPWKTVAPVGVAFALIAFGLASKISTARKKPLMTGGDELIGATGEVREQVGPSSGTILIMGELWSARSPEPLPVGSRARVMSMHGLCLEVTPVSVLEV